MLLFFFIMFFFSFNDEKRKFAFSHVRKPDAVLQTLALRLGSRCHSTRIHTGIVVINQSITDSVYFSMWGTCAKCSSGFFLFCAPVCSPSIRWSVHLIPRGLPPPLQSCFIRTRSRSRRRVGRPEWLPPSQSPTGTGTLLRPPTCEMHFHAQLFFRSYPPVGGSEFFIAVH